MAEAEGAKGETWKMRSELGGGGSHIYWPFKGFGFYSQRLGDVAEQRNSQGYVFSSFLQHDLKTRPMDPGQSRER